MEELQVLRDEISVVRTRDPNDFLGQTSMSRLISVLTSRSPGPDRCGAEESKADREQAEENGAAVPQGIGIGYLSLRLSCQSSRAETLDTRHRERYNGAAPHVCTSSKVLMTSFCLLSIAPTRCILGSATMVYTRSSGWYFRI